VYTGYGALGGACALRAVAALGLAPDDGVGEQLVGTRLSGCVARQPGATTSHMATLAL